MVPHQMPPSTPFPITYHHVDVFSDVGYSGNSLTVFVDPPRLSAGQMSPITRELKHFESIFVTSSGEGEIVDARVFDLLEELDFAGHPVLGAAAVLHETLAAAAGQCWWTFRLRARTVRVHTRRNVNGHFTASLHVDSPEMVRTVAGSDVPAIVAGLGLELADLDDGLPMDVLSAGLRYLVVPVRGREALAKARIVTPYFEELLLEQGSQFAYVLDVKGMEGRHWNNDGVVEDVATGSAAGCVAAYLLRHERIAAGKEHFLAQGRFVGRPSRIAITAYGTADAIERVTVGGDVSMVGSGQLRLLPSLEEQ